VQGETARLDDDHVGLEHAEGLGSDRRSRASRLDTDRYPARELDELGHPRSPEHDRIQPLERRHARARPRGPGTKSYRLDPGPELGPHALAFASPPDSIRDALNVREDIRKLRGAQADDAHVLPVR